MRISDNLPFRPLRFLVTWFLLTGIVFTSISEVNAGSTFSRTNEPVKLLFEPGTIDFGLAHDYSIVESNVVITNTGRQDITIVDVDLSIPATDIYIADLPIKVGRRQKVVLNIQFIPTPIEATLTDHVVNGGIKFITSYNGISDQLFIRYNPSPPLWGLTSLNDNYTQAQDSSLISLNITNTQATQDLVVSKVFERSSLPYPRGLVSPPNKGGWPITIPPGMTATVAYIKSIVTSSGNYRTLITINTAKDEVLGVIPFNMSISSIGGLRFHPEMIDFGLRRPDDYFLSHLELSARYDARPDMANTSAVEIYNVTYLSYKDNKVNNIEVIAEMKKSLVRISNKDDNVPVSNVWIDTSSSARGIIDVNGCLLVHTNISSTPIRIGVKGRVSNRLPKVYYADGEVRMQYWVEDGRVTSIDDITLTTEWGGNNIIEVVDRANVMDNALHDMVKVDIIMPTATNTGGSIKISLNHSHNILDNLGEDDRLRVFTKPTIIAVYTKDDRVMPLSLRLYTNTLIILLYNKDGRGDMVSSIYGDMKDKKFPLDSIEFGGNATVVLSISNPNPSSITIIDGLRVVEGDDGLMMNNRIEANIDYDMNGNIVLPPNGVIDMRIIIYNITEQKYITVSGHTSRGEDINITLIPNILTHDEISKARCTVLNTDNYHLTSTCLNHSFDIKNIESMDTRLQFWIQSQESSEDLLAIGRLMLDNLPTQLEVNNNCGQIVLGKGSSKAREMEWLTDRYSLVENRNDEKMFLNKIVLSGNDWKYYIQSPWVIPKQRHTSILAPYQGEVIGLRLATLGSCRGARILIYNPLKYSPIDVRIGYIVTDDDKVMAFSSAVNYSSVYGKVYQVPPQSYAYIPALRFCRLLYNGISYDGIMYIINNYTKIESLSFIIPSPDEQKEYKKGYEDDDDYVVHGHTAIDIPLPSLSLVSVVESTSLLTRLEMIYSIATGSDELAIRFGSISLQIPHIIKNEIGGKISRIQFAGEKGGCTTEAGYKLVTPLCEDGKEYRNNNNNAGVDYLNDDLTVDIVAPISVKREYDTNDDYDTSVVIIINGDNNNTTYRLLVSIEGITDERRVDMIDHTLRELIDSWPPGQIRAHLNKKASGIIEIKDDGYKVLHNKELIELLEMAVELGGDINGQTGGVMKNHRITNNNSEYSSRSSSSVSKVSLVEVISILFITGLASLKITWRGTRERKGYIARQNKIANTALRNNKNNKKKNNNNNYSGCQQHYHHRSSYSRNNNNNNNNMYHETTPPASVGRSRDGEGGGEQTIRDGLIEFFTTALERDNKATSKQQQQQQHQQHHQQHIMKDNTDDDYDGSSEQHSQKGSSEGYSKLVATPQQQQQQQMGCSSRQHKGVLHHTRVLLSNAEVVVDEQPSAVKLKNIQSAVEASMALQSKPSVVVDSGDNTTTTDAAKINRKNKQPTTTASTNATRQLPCGGPSRGMRGDRKVKGTKGLSTTAVPHFTRQHQQHEHQDSVREVKARGKAGSHQPPVVAAASQCRTVTRERISCRADGKVDEREEDDNNLPKSSLDDKSSMIHEESVDRMDEEEDKSSTDKIIPAAAAGGGVQPFDDASMLQPQTLSASLQMLFRQAPVYDTQQQQLQQQRATTTPSTAAVVAADRDDNNNDDDDLEYDITSLLNNLNREVLNNEEQHHQQQERERNTFAVNTRSTTTNPNPLVDDYGMSPCYSSSIFGYEDGGIGDALYEPVTSWLPPPPTTTTTTQQQQQQSAFATGGYQQQQQQQQQEGAPAAAQRSSPFDYSYGSSSLLLPDSGTNDNRIRQYYYTSRDGREQQLEDNDHHQTLPIHHHPTTTSSSTSTSNYGFGVESALGHQQQQRVSSPPPPSSWSTQDEEFWLSQRPSYLNGYQPQDHRPRQEEEEFVDRYCDFTSFATDTAANTSATSSSSHGYHHRRRRFGSRNLW